MVATMRLQALLLPLVAAVGLAAAPPSPTLTEDETARYAEGKVVIRHEDTPRGGRATAVLRVEAPPRAVIDAIMDLQKRPEESSVLTSVEVYRHDPAPEVIGATFTVTVLGSSTVFSILYDCHRDEGYCTYKLDPSKPQDIVHADGYYLVLPERGGTRMVFSTRADTGRSMPGWMRRWIAGSSLEGQVKGMKERAESPEDG